MHGVISQVSATTRRRKLAGAPRWHGLDATRRPVVVAGAGAAGAAAVGQQNVGARPALDAPHAGAAEVDLLAAAVAGAALGAPGLLLTRAPKAEGRAVRLAVSLPS